MTTVGQPEASACSSTFRNSRRLQAHTCRGRRPEGGRSKVVTGTSHNALDSSAGWHDRVPVGHAAERRREADVEAGVEAKAVACSRAQRCPDPRPNCLRETRRRCVRRPRRAGGIPPRIEAVLLGSPYALSSGPAKRGSPTHRGSVNHSGWRWRPISCPWSAIAWTHLAQRRQPERVREQRIDEVGRLEAVACERRQLEGQAAEIGCRGSPEILGHLALVSIADRKGSCGQPAASGQTSVSIVNSTSTTVRLSRRPLVELRARPSARAPAAKVCVRAAQCSVRRTHRPPDYDATGVASRIHDRRPGGPVRSSSANLALLPKDRVLCCSDPTFWHPRRASRADDLNSRMRPSGRYVHDNFAATTCAAGRRLTG